MTGSFRVLVGHEPRFYREALAEALLCLRPDLNVVLCEPELLDEEVERDGHCLVICSRLSPVILTQALASVLLYPDGENRAETRIAGHKRSYPGIGISDLLTLIEESAQLAREAVRD